MDKNIQLRLSEVIDQAIIREKESRTLYLDLAKDVSFQRVANLFKKLADEELEHVKILDEVKLSPSIMLKLNLPPNFYIEEEQAKPPPIFSQMNPKDVIKFAISREQAAFNYYRKLNKSMKDDAICNVFENLANWEYGHISKLEHILKTI
ncbi:MAG: ferritin family protein [Pseudomonadota bacterium]